MFRKRQIKGEIRLRGVWWGLKSPSLLWSTQCNGRHFSRRKTQWSLPPANHILMISLYRVIFSPAQNVLLFRGCIWSDYVRSWEWEECRAEALFYFTFKWKVSFYLFSYLANQSKNNADLRRADALGLTALIARKPLMELLFFRCTSYSPKFFTQYQENSLFQAIEMCYITMKLLTLSPLSPFVSCFRLSYCFLFLWNFPLYWV